MPVALAAALMTAAPAGAAQKVQRVPGKEFAAALKPELTRSLKVRATKVTCPKRVRNRKGYTFRCTARFASGDTVRVRVKLLDRNGSFRMSLVDLLLRHLETQLEGYLATTEHKGSTVTCPKKRVVRKNDKFRCAVAREGADVGAYDITQLGNGLVKYAWVAPAPPPSG